jgi:hypothetical protein
VTEGTVEEKILERATKKLKMENLIMQKGRFSNTNDGKLQKQEIVKIVQFGAQKILDSNDDFELAEDDIDNIMKHSNTKMDIIKEELQKLEDRLKLTNFSVHDETNVYEFDGEDYKGKREAKMDFIDVGERKTKKRHTYDIDKYYRDVMNIPSPKDKKKATGWRHQVNGGYSHQFFNEKELDELEQKYLSFTANPQTAPAFTPEDQARMVSL